MAPVTDLMTTVLPQSQNNELPTVFHDAVTWWIPLLVGFLIMLFIIPIAILLWIWKKGNQNENKIEKPSSETEQQTTLQENDELTKVCETVQINADQISTKEGKVQNVENESEEENECSPFITRKVSKEKHPARTENQSDENKIKLDIKLKTESEYLEETIKVESKNPNKPKTNVAAETSNFTTQETCLNNLSKTTADKLNMSSEDNEAKESITENKNKLDECDFSSKCYCTSNADSEITINVHEKHCIEDQSFIALETMNQQTCTRNSENAEIMNIPIITNEIAEETNTTEIKYPMISKETKVEDIVSTNSLQDLNDGITEAPFHKSTDCTPVIIIEDPTKSKEITVDITFCPVEDSNVSVAKTETLDNNQEESFQKEKLEQHPNLSSSLELHKAESENVLKIHEEAITEMNVDLHSDGNDENNLDSAHFLEENNVPPAGKSDTTASDNLNKEDDFIQVTTEESEQLHQTNQTKSNDFDKTEEDLDISGSFYSYETQDSTIEESIWAHDESLQKVVLSSHTELSTSMQNVLSEYSIISDSSLIRSPRLKEDEYVIINKSQIEQLSGISANVANIKSLEDDPNSNHIYLSEDAKTFNQSQAQAKHKDTELVSNEENDTLSLPSLPSQRPRKYSVDYAVEHHSLTSSGTFFKHRSPRKNVDYISKYKPVVKDYMTTQETLADILPGAPFIHVFTDQL